MRDAICIVTGEPITADHHRAAICPECGKSLISKCGGTTKPYWSHKIESDCGFGSNGESEWHREWKALFPKRYREIDMVKHIADVATPDVVIEFQNSYISDEDIRSRTDFYLSQRKSMRWVLNTARFRHNLTMYTPWDDGRSADFLWKRPCIGFREVYKEYDFDVETEHPRPYYRRAHKVFVLFDFGGDQLFVGEEVTEYANGDMWGGLCGSRDVFLNTHLLDLL